MMTPALKAPFPWFGGKSVAAPAVWSALGDVEHYVEPFAGSLAVLLGRPHLPNRAYYSETVNDADGLLCNAWRAIQQHPDAVAEACSWPISEADIHARHVALLRWRESHELEHLMGDPRWCDPEMAGWWLYGIAGWIGSGWCSGEGPWDADETGRLVRRPRAGRLSRRLPHLSNNGQGVAKMTLREPGIKRQRPHVTNDGLGVAHAGLREPGIAPDCPDHVSELLHPSGAPEDYHPLVMPKLRAWFAALSARLRHVRIVHGDWQRVVA